MNLNEKIETKKNILDHVLKIQKTRLDKKPLTKFNNTQKQKQVDVNNPKGYKQETKDEVFTPNDKLVKEKQQHGFEREADLKIQVKVEARKATIHASTEAKVVNSLKAFEQRKQVQAQATQDLLIFKANQLIAERAEKKAQEDELEEKKKKLEASLIAMKLKEHVERQKRTLSENLSKLITMLGSVKVRHIFNVLIKPWLSSTRIEQREETLFLDKLPSAEIIFERLFVNKLEDMFIGGESDIIPDSQLHLTNRDLLLNAVVGLLETKSRAHLIIGLARARQSQTSKSLELSDEVRRYLRLPDGKKHPELALRTSKVIKALTKASDHAKSATSSDAIPVLELNEIESASEKPVSIWIVTFAGVQLTDIVMPPDPSKIEKKSVFSELWNRKGKPTIDDESEAQEQESEERCKDENTRLSTAKLFVDSTDCFFNGTALEKLLDGLSKELKEDDAPLPDKATICFRLTYPCFNPCLYANDRLYKLPKLKFKENCSYIVNSFFGIINDNKDSGGYAKLIEIFRKIRTEIPDPLHFIVRKSKELSYIKPYFMDNVNTDVSDLYFKVIYALALPVTEQERAKAKKLTEERSAKGSDESIIIDA